jgi:uncharacterized integral membrane protein (TIGR00698 family)
METSLPSTGPALDVAVGAAAPSPTSSLVQRALQGAAGVIPGLLPATVLGLAAYGIGKLVPEVGGPVIAVLAGIGVAAAAGHRPSWVQGIRFGTHQLLKTAIVLLGFGLSLSTVLSTVRSSGVVMLGTLATGLAAAAIGGRLLGVRGARQALVGVGTSICGASAIAAAAGVLEPDDDDVAYAITVIFVFNVAAVLTFPVLARALHMGGHTFGVWAGTAVNDMSSVVAATSVFGHGSIHTGVVVKLARTLMILPVSAGLAVARGRRERAASTRGRGRKIASAFPLFLVLFLVASFLRSLGAVGPSLAGATQEASLVVITIALAAVGLSARIDHIKAAGFRPLVFGAFLWVVIAATSLGLQALVR